MGLILVANPGSASRKYALFDSALSLLVSVHFEFVDNKPICTIHLPDGTSHEVPLTFTDVSDAAAHVESILRTEKLLADTDVIERIGLRVVAPSAYFLTNHVLTEEVIAKLESLRIHAPLHIGATLDEFHILRDAHPDAMIVGVSDSAFHATKPNYAWNYGIDIHDADQLDIKRFGYHGISVAASIDSLWSSGKLPSKVVVCHLGSGSSVTGVFHGRSVDTSMGYSPLEGVVMASRSGSIDITAAHALKRGLNLDDEALEEYLNHKGGLIGLGNSDDIRELISREADGDHIAHLALTTLIHTIHKAIGAMIVALNGCDMIVFTGTVGERSAILRKRIAAHLEFMDFILDGEANEACTNPTTMTFISQKAQSRPIVVIPTDEAREIASHTQRIS